MKKNFTLRLKQLFVLCALLLCFQANAEKVENVTAASVGQFFMSQTLGVNSNDVHLNTVYTAVDAANPAEALYYVFNINQQQKFVIVSANDIATPILGYSLQGIYDPNNLPPNFETWMNSVAEAIGQGIQQGVEANEQITAEWASLLEHDVNYFIQRAGERAVEPLITTKWDQGDPYNQQCPLYGSVKCMTGCVATAMAQVMKYHAHPESGTGTIPAYTTTTYSISVPAITLGTPYNFNDMGGTSPTTTSAKENVARLMYHCGASVKMNYGPSESGAYTTDAGKALTTFFKYDKSMRMQDRSYYSNEQWIALLKQELDANRPMYHNGSGSAGGHAFVCDGYNNSNMFHFNWGWSGYGDGYFSVTPLSSFPNNNNVFVGQKADAGGAQSYQIDMYHNTNLMSTVTSVQPMQTFSVSAQFYNSGYADVSGNMQGAIGLYQGSNLIVMMGTRNLSGLQAGYYFTSAQSFSCQIPSGTATGNYTIRALIKTSTSDWEVARASFGYKTELPLQVTPKTYTITAQAETGGSIDPQGNIQVGEGESKTFTFKANSGYVISKVLIDGYNNPTAVADGSYTFSNVTADHSITVRFEQITYAITATAGENGTIAPSGIVNVPEGSSKIFTIEANENYEIADVLVDGTSVGAQPTYTFSNVTSNHTIEATFKLEVGITEQDISSKITIYPNPTNEEFKVSGFGFNVTGIEIFDVMGKQFQSSMFNVQGSETLNFKPETLNFETVIDISQLPSGVYFIRIQTGEGMVTKKVVKM